MAHSESSNTPKSITLTVDGIQVSVAAGSTILEAAQTVGIKIPTLCWLDKISTTGACRICAVHVEGVARPMTACNTPVKEGIVVTTQSPELSRLRKQTMELLLVNHPLDCPVCDAAGECDLQDTCYALGVDKPGFGADLERLPIRYDWTLLESDPNRCILCEKCVKVCREITGVGAIETVSCGDRAIIDTIDGKPLNCDFCGNCVAACPTGTLISKPFKFAGRPWTFEVKQGICGFCSSGCQVEYHVQNGTVGRVTSEDSTYNSGNLCINGRFGYAAFNNPERITAPQLRAEAAGTDVSWDTALHAAVAETKSVVAAHGANAVAGICSPRVTNEELALFADFMTTAVGSTLIGSEADLGYRQAQAIQKTMLGCTGATKQMDALEEMSGILVLGSDLKAESAGFGYRVIKAATKKDAKLVILSARPTSLDAFANCALRYTAGSEGFVALGLIKSLITSGRPVTAAGFDALQSMVAGISFDQIQAATGIPEAGYAECIELLGGNSALLYGYEFIRSAAAEAAVTNVMNLALMLNADVFPIEEKNNMQGLINQMAGVSSADLLSIVDGIEKGTIHSLYVMGTDLFAIVPNRQRLAAALAKLTSLVVLDAFPTATTAAATIVLPVALTPEKAGSYTTVDNRTQSFAAASTVPGQARSDFAILSALYQGMTGEEGPALSAISQKVSAQPVAGRTTSGQCVVCTPQAAAHGTMTGLIVPILHHNGSYTTWSENNLNVVSQPVVSINAQDAQKLGVATGGSVTISANNGTVQAVVAVSDDTPCGLVIIPNHFAAAGVMALQNKAAASVTVTVTKA